MRRSGFSVALVLALTLATAAYAAQPLVPARPDRQLIHLQAATFDPLNDAAPALASFASTQAAGQQNPYYLLQFNGLVEQAWLEQLAVLGAELIGYIPDNTHLVRVAPEHLARVRSHPAVRWIGQYAPGYKLAPALAQPATAGSIAGTSNLLVALHPGEPLEPALAFLQGLGAEISEASETAIGAAFRIRVAPAALQQIAANPAVSWIEPDLELRLANAEGRKIMNVESVWQSFGYYGNGQIVAISDSGLSVQVGANTSTATVQNADFGTNRLIRAFSPAEMVPGNASCGAKTTWTDLNGHGTHVAGSVLGNGVNSGANVANRQYANSFAGSAPEARFVFMAMNTDGSNGIQCVPVNGNYIALGYENGARISSNSWGSNDAGAYGFNSRVIDDYVWRNRDYLVLYANGNAGPGSNTVGSPATAKNVLSVGASENNRPDRGSLADNINEVANFSSRGPTDDGRIKPEVVAPGTFILSVKGEQATGDIWAPFNNNYVFLGGTSMATPLTAGAAALVREWVQKQRGIENPSAALMKALMIHAATQLPGSNAPNNTSGWGRVDVRATLNAPYVVFDDNVQGITQGQERSYTVQVVGSSSNGTLYYLPDGLPQSADENTLAGAQDTGSITLEDQLDPALTAAQGSQNTEMTLQAVEGYGAPADLPRIPDTRAESGVAGPQLPSSNTTAGATLSLAENGVAAYPQGMVGGGDFEDPDWSEIWSDVWFGYGIPVRTPVGDSNRISGDYSMWLGGTALDDSIWYPVGFPERFDSNTNYLQYKFRMTELDPGFDYACYAITDASYYVIGDIIGCYSSSVIEDAVYQLTLNFSAQQRAALAGETGYLVLYTVGDSVEPHMSYYVDDVQLVIDFEQLTLGATPGSGPPGSTFLLSGSNGQPYGPVDICQTSCPGGKLGTVYADERGDFLAYLETNSNAEPGSYLLEARTQVNANRKATTTIRLTGASNPTLSVDPSSGPPGTSFEFNGSNFLPNDSAIQVKINGETLGTVGSDGSGNLAFSLNTASNTPAATYSVQVVDSGNRSAQTQFTVTAAGGGQPSMTVNPQSGPPGSSFSFTGSNFTPNQTVTFFLDGQQDPIGSITATAAGGFSVTLNTNAQIAPGSYTLQAVQGQLSASATFQITSGGGGGGGTGSGLIVTLVWTDPPAQTSASVFLINNLDLRVVGPNNTVYRGNGGSNADTVNTVETVRLANPAAGTYTIYVTGSRVNASFGQQPYALLASTAQSNGANVRIGAPEFGNRVFVPIARR